MATLVASPRPSRPPSTSTAGCWAIWCYQCWRLKLREATTGRLDRLLLRLRDQSVNRQRKAKVVRGPCSTLLFDMTRSRRTRPAGRAGFTAEAGDQGASGRGPGRDPRSCTPVGQRGPPRAQVRHGRHHRPDARHWLSHRRDPGLALERPGPRWRSTHPHGVGHDQDRDRNGHVAEAHAEVGRQPANRVLPRFAAELLRVRQEFATPNENDAVFATRNGTWHQVVNVERRWRQIRKDTGYEWVTPHTFRKTVRP